MSTAGISTSLEKRGSKEEMKQVKEKDMWSRKEHYFYG